MDLSNCPRGCFPSLSESELYMLFSAVTKLEVKQVLFSMKPLNAPGMDGLHAIFFQKNWHLVKGSLIRLVNNSLKGDPLLPNINKTLIVLILKISSPEFCSHVRPINLCSIVYKLVTKVIANRCQFCERQKYYG